MTDNRTNFRTARGLAITDRISRRALLKAALAAGIVGSTAGLLAACGNDSQDDASPGPETDPEDDQAEDETDDLQGNDPDSGDESTGEPRRGGVVRVSMPGFPESLDPHVSSWIESIYPSGMIYSGLVRMGPDMEPIAELATSWHSNDTADEWTFEILGGVLFQNGREMTADDVVYSFERIVDPELGSPFSTQLEMIESIEAPDDETVVFHLNTSYADFPTVLSNSFGRVVPEEAADNLDTEPVGTGPYKLERLVTGERIVITRFDEYYDLDNFGFIDEIHYITMAEETSRMAALSGGDIDLVPDISPTVVQLAENDPNIVVGEVVTGAYNPAVMVTTEEPFTDNRVRTAVKLCADRSQFLTAAVLGRGEEAADQPIPSIDPMYGDLPIPERNIERALELLEEAGYHDGIDLVLHTSAGRIGMQETALALQEMADPAGIRIEIQNHPIDNFWADYWMQASFFVGNWNGRPNADQVFSVAFVTDATWNEANWSNEEFDETVRMAREALDEDERRDLYRRAQEIVAEDGGVIITFFRTGLDARVQRLKGYESHPFRWAELQRAWLED